MNKNLADSSPALLYTREWQGTSAPDLALFIKQFPSLSWEEMAGICIVDFRQRFARGERRSVEDYLRLLPDLAGNDQFILDLLYAEYVRRKEAGEHPIWEEYEKRFPRLADQIERQFSIDRLLDVYDSEKAMTSGAATGAHLETMPPEANTHPTHIGRYAVLSLLDAGGQGIVYRAIHPGLQKEVVIKMNRFASGVLNKEALIAEGRLLAELEHPNLCRVLDLDFDEATPFLVLEYVRGQNLHQLATTQRLPPIEAAQIVAAVARAVDHAHRNGVIHRDIKPKNVVIDLTGRPILIDFGLARLRGAWRDDWADAGEISGTVGFMAPEQARGENNLVTAKADVFGLGGVLYYLLTGKPPFASDSLSECLRLATRCEWNAEALLAPGIPPQLAGICRQALAAKPDDRPTSAQFAAMLDGFISPPRFKRRWPLVAATAALVVALTLMFFNRSTPSRPLKEEPPAAYVMSGDLSVLAWVGDRYVALPEPAPLRNGMKMRLEATLPAGFHAALAGIDSDGVVSLLKNMEPAGEPTTLNYPEVGKSAKLGGNPGTEIIFLLARPDAPISIPELRSIFDPAGPWPVLPDVSVLQLRGTKVKALQKGRDFTVIDQSDPEGDMARKLTELGKQLTPRFPEVHALAFKHQK